MFVTAVARFFGAASAIVGLSIQPLYGWDSPLEKPDDRLLASHSCGYQSSDWYRQYLEAIHSKGEAKFPSYDSDRKSNAYELGSAVLARAISDPRAQTILALEQFRESASLIVESKFPEQLTLSAQVLREKAFLNIDAAANKGDINAATFQALWEYLGLKTSETHRDPLDSMKTIAERGSSFGQQIYVEHRSSREWDFFLEAIQSEKKPMGYFRCGNNLSFAIPALLTSLDEVETFPSSEYGKEPKHYWNPFNLKFSVSFPAKNPRRWFFSSLCVHMAYLAKHKQIQPHAVIPFAHECLYGDYAVVVDLLEHLAGSGDPVVIFRLAKLYLLDLDPSNDKKAEELLLLNADVQPIWSRNHLIAAYSTNLKDPKKCLKTKKSLMPFYEDLKKINKHIDLETPANKFVAKRWRDQKSNFRTGEYFEKTMGYVEFSAGFHCFDSQVTVNGETYKLFYDPFGVVVPIYFSLDKPREFLNVKGRIYPSTRGFNPDYSLKEQSRLITGSIFIGKESN
ncbi:hypothetical protein OA249_01155 [Litorivicinus sp.]|nr:hypothetical protein [Litorivicinus sp.]